MLRHSNPEMFYFAMGKHKKRMRNNSEPLYLKL